MTSKSFYRDSRSGVQRREMESKWNWEKEGQKENKNDITKQNKKNNPRKYRKGVHNTART